METYFISIEELNSNVETTFRGMAVYDENTAWVSGNLGTVLKTEDGGNSWEPQEIPEGDSLDFRDIQILGKETILLMSVGNGRKSRIYNSEDNGKTWKKTYTNEKEKAFFNGFSFWNNKEGLLLSDPIADYLYLLKTEDGGNTWNPLPAKNMPKLSMGEYGFAASGTGVITFGNGQAWVGTGGKESNVYVTTNQGKSWKKHPSPIYSGKPSAGIFSMDFRSGLDGIIVGGDYLNPDTLAANAASTKDGGKTWKIIDNNPPILHKACVKYLGEKCYIATGRTGTIFSEDDGKSWSLIDEDIYYTIGFNEEAKTGFMAGAEGKIAKIRLNKNEGD